MEKEQWLQLLEKQYDKFVTHVKIKRFQARSYTEMIASTSPEHPDFNHEHAVIQFD